MDYLTGGGIPLDMITEISGPYSCGKTTLALIIANSFLTAMPESNVVYLDFEQTFDKKWASSIISDPERLIVISPPYGEVGLEMVLELIKSRANIALYILDSLAAIVPISETDGTMDDQQVGLQARLLGKFFRKYLAEKARCDYHVTLLVLNQIRSKVGARPYTPAFTAPTGFAHEHYAAVWLKLGTKGFVKNAEQIPVRQTITITVEKNKTGGAPPRMAGEIHLCLVDQGSYKRGEPYEVATLVDTAKEIGLIEKESGVITILGKAFTSIKALENEIRHDRQFRSNLKSMLLEKLLNDGMYCVPLSC